MLFKQLKIGDRFRFKNNKLYLIATKLDDLHFIDDYGVGHASSTTCVIRLVKKKKPATEAPATIPPPDEQPKLTKNKDTEENKIFWANAEDCAKEVASWPAWKRGEDMRRGEAPKLVPFDTLKSGEWFCALREMYMVVNIEHKNGCVNSRGIIHWFGPQYDVQPLSRAEVAAYLLKGVSK